MTARERCPPCGPSHRRRIEVNDEVAPNPDCCPVDADQAVDVLGAEDDEGHALCVPEGVNQGGLHVLFGRALLGTVRVVTDVGTLQEQNVDPLGRLPEKLTEDRALATVAPEVARVVEPTPAGLHQEAVGVEAAVIVQVGRDGERAESEGLPVLEMARPLNVEAHGREEGGLPQNSSCRRTDVERNMVRHLGKEAEVVGMGMAHQDTQQGRVRLLRNEPPHAGEGHLLAIGHRDRKTEVEKDAMSI